MLGELRGEGLLPAAVRVALLLVVLHEELGAGLPQLLHLFHFVVHPRLEQSVLLLEGPLPGLLPLELGLERRVLLPEGAVLLLLHLGAHALPLVLEPDDHLPLLHLEHLPELLSPRFGRVGAQLEDALEDLQLVHGPPPAGAGGLVRVGAAMAAVARVRGGEGRLRVGHPSGGGRVIARALAEGRGLLVEVRRGLAEVEELLLLLAEGADGVAAHRRGRGVAAGEQLRAEDAARLARLLHAEGAQDVLRVQAAGELELRLQHLLLLLLLGHLNHLLRRHVVQEHPKIQLVEGVHRGH
mmetsp:Transcript_31531/g.68132  ORF Transcript_31531/g.68132 Transcript_31531/m.68132 type:complete len:297 (-) Transcript_31531:214-1104(-)